MTWGTTPHHPPSLEAAAALLARSHTVALGKPGFRSFRRRLRGVERKLRGVLQLLSEDVELSAGAGRSGEWLLDNDYLLQATLEYITEALPRDFYRGLPHLTTGPLQGRSRIYAIARSFVGRRKGEVDIDKLIAFVSAYQQAAGLAIAELWALPIMLRLAALERITELAPLVFGLAEPAQGTAAAAAETGGRGRERADREDAGRREPEGPSELAAGGELINCIVSLRELGTQDWRSFFEAVSRVDQALRQDPPGVYGRMDFETRDRYRGAIERLARATDWRAEEWIAQQAVALARASDVDTDRRRHVGYWLIDAGREELERAVGYAPSWLRRLGRFLLAHAAPVYLGAVALLTGAVGLALCLYAARHGAGTSRLLLLIAVAAIPASSLALSLVNFLVAHTARPQVLPKLDFEDGIPADARTVVAVPSLLSSAAEVDSLLAELEIRYLANPDVNLLFALLTDFVDAPQQHMPEDQELIERATRGIAELNLEHGGEGRGPFLLFHRERVWNPSAGCWMGWERKRGKLVEFNRLLAGSEETSYRVHTGAADALAGVRFVITLDADTKLPRTTAARLVGAMAHPLNRPRFDPVSGEVVAGYTILQPRVAVDPSSANRTAFSRLVAGDRGLDLYSQAVSDVYQDLFGEGNYAGKGIYDPVAFERSLEGRVPENALLSHDLFEAAHGRAGLVSDVVVFEEFPADVETFVLRLHRWVRGDWQLLPWLLPWVPAEGGRRIRNHLSLLDRWKMIDNLRRSLLSASIVVLLVAGWTWLPGSPWTWTGVAVTIVGASVVLTGLGGFQRVALGPARLPALAGTGWSIRVELLRRLLSLTFTLFVALTSCDAVVRTLYRLAFSRQRLLEWVPAARAASLRDAPAGAGAGAVWRRMAPVVILILGITALVAWHAAVSRPVTILIAAPFLLLWLASPQIAYWAGRVPAARDKPLTATEERRLRLVARHTWFFFERFVGADTHWLPPDHYQEEPGGEVAQRTSPTDVGMMLLATVSAHDLGYLGPLELAARLHNSFDSMDTLERYWGHLLNWYDTHTLLPLEPRYVSTVDSGNLAGALIAVARGCEEILERDFGQPRLRSGLVDTLEPLNRSLQRLEPGAERDELLASLRAIRRRIVEARGDAEWIRLLGELCDRTFPACEELIVSLVEKAPATLDFERVAELRMFSELFDRSLRRARRDLRALAPWLEVMAESPALYREAEGDAPLAEAWGELVRAFSEAPSLRQIPSVCDRAVGCIERLDGLLAARAADSASEDAVGAARDWNRLLGEALDSARRDAELLVSELERVAARADALFEEMDFSFLFDRRRQIFHIGFNVTTAKLDPNHYDLLASEARLAGLLAIAKGDAPQSHWLHLGRPFTGVQGTRALVSWGGTAFEYLLPALLVRTPAETLLGQSCGAAVDAQVAFARRHRIPWGTSESGYYQFDQHGHYQYRAFGMPSLGLALGLGERLVVTPYASVLALAFRRRAALRNIEVLEGLGMLGRYGLFEALDYGARDANRPARPDLVRSYMVHHQGMILVAITNLLTGGRTVDRFHADPRVASVEPLVYEQLARGVPLSSTWRRTRPTAPAPRAAQVAPWPVATDHPCTQVNVLSNGSLSVLITANGGGTAWRGQVALTRWSADPTVDGWGTWVYVRDERSGELWSIGREPMGAEPQQYEVSFGTDRAEFRCRERGVSLRMEVTVSPDDDVELRRLTILNESARSRRLALTSYAEPVLSPRPDDRRHPAFNKLFVESLSDETAAILLFRRRPRSADEAPIHLAHAVTGRWAGDPELGRETDRERFLGRKGSRRAPQALAGLSRHRSRTTGATLDPIMSMSCEVELAPHQETEVTFLTATAGSAAVVRTLIDDYRSPARIEQAFRDARQRSERELEAIGMTGQDLREALELLSATLYPQPALRRVAGGGATFAHQRRLWAQGVSGDLPIVLAIVRSEEDAGFLGPLLRAHALWRRRGMQVDLVVIDDHGGGYTQALRDRVVRMLERLEEHAVVGAPGGCHLIGGDQLSAADREAFQSVARVVLEADAGPLGLQLAPARVPPRRLPTFFPVATAAVRDEGTEPVPRPADLLFDNGLGGFSQDGREYVLYLEHGSRPPSPWINVVANPSFGFVVSESGGGYTWAGNSAENRLTPWANDPVLDPPGEVLYLRDEETAAVWSTTPQPLGDARPYLVRQGAGYTCFEHNSRGLEQRTRLFCHPREPVKFVSLRLTNRWSRPRRITATYYAEWVLGTTREESAPFVVPEYDVKSGALLARNTFALPVDSQTPVAFLASSLPLHGMTADRTEFLGRGGDPARPEGLFRMGLAGTVRAGVDPCAALQVHIDLPPGATAEVHFLLGQGRDREHAVGLINRLRSDEQIARAWKEQAEMWDRLLGAVTIRTPNRAMDLMVNRWLLYQAVSCRLWGRTALFQSSGAYGFRDQLQDVLALLVAAPELAREHILRAAAHQFSEGDVLHWWHPPSTAGVRTRCSDDLLWLPFAAAHYVTSTGDATLLDEEVSFLSGPPLQEGVAEHYGEFESTVETASLYEHCLRAIERGTTRGRNGLPLIGSGDWNDGLNRVGIGGEGESVWLGWFLYAVLDRFAGICQARGDGVEATRLRQRAATLQEAIEASGWDGNWYLRAFFDDGTPLGSARGAECRIDAISQAWAVMSGAGAPDRCARAMSAVDERLVRDDDRLVLLLTPPFEKAPWDPGYIKGYPPGVRENGGQYTHAAIWAAWAFAELGDGDLGKALFDILNPINRSNRPTGVERYRVEPYAMAADVYGEPPFVGRGGWTWYTGAAAWMYRLAVERILGLRLRGGRLYFDPRVPRSWERFEIEVRHRGAELYIEVENPRGVNRGVERVELDGRRLAGNELPTLEAGRRHRVRVVLG